MDPCSRVNDRGRVSWMTWDKLLNLSKHRYVQLKIKIKTILTIVKTEQDYTHEAPSTVLEYCKHSPTAGHFHYYFKPWAQVHERIRKQFLLRMPHLKTRPGPAQSQPQVEQENTPAPHRRSGLSCEQYFSSIEPSSRAENSICRARHMSLPLLCFRSARKESFQSLARKARPPTTCLPSRALRCCSLGPAGE